MSSSASSTEYGASPFLGMFTRAPPLGCQSTLHMHTHVLVCAHGIIGFVCAREDHMCSLQLGFLNWQFFLKDSQGQNLETSFIL